MMNKSRKCKVASVQATPVIFDLEKSLEKVISLAGEAAALGCKLIVFPETFIPGYPAGLGFGTVVGSRTEAGRDQFREYWQNSVEVPGVHTDKLAKCAKENTVFLAVGVTERDRVNKTLYCTLLFFGPNGSLLGWRFRLGSEGQGTRTVVIEKFGHVVHQSLDFCFGSAATRGHAPDDFIPTRSITPFVHHDIHAVTLETGVEHQGPVRIFRELAGHIFKGDIIFRSLSFFQNQVHGSRGVDLQPSLDRGFKPSAFSSNFIRSG